MIKRLALLTTLLAGPALGDPVVVFAAASLKGPLDLIAAEADDVVVSYGGSGAIARQILQGAPADLVLLANIDWMDVLTTADVVEEVDDFASNTLVLIGAAPATVDLANLPELIGGDRIVMGFTNAVPAGIYAKAALTSLGHWDTLADNTVEVDNVRAARTLVARAEVPFGITYATDAQASDAVHVMATFDSALHPDIRYVGGVVSDNPNAREFWDLVRGHKGQSILAQAGFLPPLTP